ncbi:MAG: ABC transporter substrate-binding protein [Chloroflexi bacterium]|nr:ABC transporter substrate-binding protein [Chloroflexota bacterium]
MNKRSYLIAGVLLMVALIAATYLILGQDNDEAEDDSQQTFTVGFVNIAAILNPTVDGFKEQMAEYGYTEGENITYIYNGPVARDALASEIQSLIDQDVDLIVSLTTPASVTVKEMTAENQIPVVFVPVTDPISAGLVTSLVAPGGNITGIISGSGENRRLEWLKTIGGDVQRVYLPFNPNDASASLTVAELQTVAEALDIELVTLETPDNAAVEAAIASIPEDVDAIFLPPDSLVGSYFEDWIARGIELNLPTSGSSLSHVEAGVLCSFSYSPVEAGKQAARLADQILKGTNPGDLPVETSEPLLSVNLVTANAMGLEIDEDTLQLANIIIR